jgi:hypothetical protein
MCIDYMLFKDSHWNKNNKVLEVKKNSTKVEPFFIKGRPFTQLSDHYGISTVLQLKSN